MRRRRTSAGPIEFVFPGYRGERPGLCPRWAPGSRSTTRWRSGARPRASRRLSAHALYALSPHLRTAGLEGAQVYVDCQTDDARLVLENVLDAEAAGAAVANHLRVESHRAAIAAAGARASCSPTPRPARRFEVGRPRRPERDRPVHRRLPHGRPRSPPAPDAGRSPGVRRRARAARRPGARAPHAARQPAVLRAARGAPHRHRDHRHRLAPRRAPAARRTTTSARAARTSPICSRPRTTLSPAWAWRRTTCVSTYAGAAAAARQGAHTPSETSREHEICAQPPTGPRRRGRQADDAAPDGRGGRRPRRRDAAWPPGSSGRSRPARRPTARCRAAAAHRRRCGGGLAARRDAPASRRRTAAGPTRLSRSRARRPSRRTGSIRSCRTSGPRSFTRRATSTRASSPTFCGRRVPLFRDAATRGSRPPRTSRRSSRASSAGHHARRERSLVDYRSRRRPLAPLARASSRSTGS